MIEIIQQFGYIGIALTIFLEIAFMIFPLPGDTLLFATGILTDSGILNYWILIFTAFFASVISGHTGYFLGTKFSRETLMHNKIYKVKESHIVKTEKFFQDYGFYAIVLSRFVPIVRNFISQIMGIINYDKRKFFWANLVASIIWPMTIVTLGNLLGKMFPNLIVYAEYGMVAVLVILGYPILHEFYKTKREKREEKKRDKKENTI